MHTGHNGSLNVHTRHLREYRITYCNYLSLDESRWVWDSVSSTARFKSILQVTRITGELQNNCNYKFYIIFSVHKLVQMITINLFK